MSRPDFIVSCLDFDEPRRLSADEIVDYLATPDHWYELSIGPQHSRHPSLAEYPFMHVEFHGRAGYSLLLFSEESAIGALAATRSELSKPRVYVCLGGQVIEKWPEELFLPPETAVRVIDHFFSAAEREPSAAWIRLDRFKRETVHRGGKGLIPMWEKLRAAPDFPLSAT